MRFSIFHLLPLLLVSRQSNAKVATVRGLISELPSNPPSVSFGYGQGDDPSVLGGDGHGQQITDPNDFDENGNSNLIDEPEDDEDEVLGGDDVDEEVAGMDEDSDEPTDSAGSGDIDTDEDEPVDEMIGNDYVDGNVTDDEFGDYGWDEEDDEFPNDEDEDMDGIYVPEDETEAPTSAIGFVDTVAPSPISDDVLSPTISPTLWLAPFPTPTWGTPPAAKPVIYVATDDDPLQQEDESIAEKENEEEGSKTGGIGDLIYFDHAESLEEMEHDRNVAIALGVCFGIGFCLLIMTAHQMLENPDGCCASICRLVVACQCAITRCVCFPCRLICGSTGRSNQRYSNELGYSRNQYSSDLELT